MLNTTEAGPTISETDIQRFEQRHSMILPSDYKRFLLLKNGGRPERDLFFVPESKMNLIARVHFFFSINDPVKGNDLDWILDTVASKIQKGVLPIAKTEGPDKICLEVTGDYPGRILFWDVHILKGENVYPVAKSFTEFVEGLFRDKDSPDLNMSS